MSSVTLTQSLSIIQCCGHELAVDNQQIKSTKNCRFGIIFSKCLDPNSNRISSVATETAIITIMIASLCDDDRPAYAELSLPTAATLLCYK